MTTTVVEAVTGASASELGNERYAGIVASAMDAIIAVDSQHRITVFNAAAERMFLYSVDQAVGKPVSLLIPERFHPIHESHINNFAKMGITGRAMGNLRPLSAIRSNGEEFPIEASISHLGSDQEQLFTVIVRDITDRAEAEKHALQLAGELEAANQTLREQIDQRHEAERALLEANQELKVRAAELEQNTSSMERLTEMGEFLQACVSSSEASDVIEQCLPKVLFQTSGAVYIHRDFGGTVETFAKWNCKDAEPKQTFEPRECWGLRRGRPHLTVEGNGATRCGHVQSLGDGVSICVPMMAQGVPLGVLHAIWAGKSQEVWSESQERLAVAVADTISLAIANVRLREKLREQTIRDPLTGLYNRRYLEDCLTREISRAHRSGTSIGIIMLDVDDFKYYNDSFGHHIGDELLRELGKYLKGKVRPEDIPARYGGEEFTLILPGASSAIVQARAETLRRGFHGLQLDGASGSGKKSKSVSLSCGVAVFPEHGASVESILKAADEALYEAKRSGKNCVMVSGKKADAISDEQVQAV